MIFQIEYQDSAQLVKWNTDLSIQQEIFGEGSYEKKNFILVKSGCAVNVHSLLRWEKSIVSNFGIRYERTQRGGDPLEKIQLNSLLIDFGLDVEIFKQFDIVSGIKDLFEHSLKYSKKLKWRK